MESPEHDTPEPRPKSRRATRLRRVVAVLFVIAIVGICRIWYGPGPAVPKNPVHSTRGDDGVFVRSGADDPSSEGRLEFHAGTLKASNQFNSTVASSHAGNARFPCRRLIVLNHSDHVLLGLVGFRLVHHLEQLPYLDTIDYYPAGHGPPPGQLAPDIVVHLDLERITESGFPPVRKLDTEILVTASNRYESPRAYYHDSLSPPVVEFKFTGDLHHVSTTTGINSPSARFKQASENIAEEIAGNLAAKFKDFREKEGPLPDLPDSFYPPYQRPEPLHLAEVYDLELLVTQRGFLAPSESYWRLATSLDASELLPEIEARLEAGGWRTSRLNASSDQNAYLRMTKGRQTLTVFPRERTEPRTATLESAKADDATNEAPALLEYLVHHLVLQSHEELRRGIDALMDAEASPATLLIFEQQFEEEHWRRLVARLEAHPPRTAQGWLVLARRYHRQENDDAARDALRRAAVLRRMAPTLDTAKTDLDHLAKELEIDGLGSEPVSAELLEDLGFIALDPADPIPALEVGVDEPIYFYARDPGGGMKLFSLRVVRETENAGAPSYSLLHVHSQDNMRSTGKGGLSFSTQLGPSRTATFKATRLEGDDERFRLDATIRQP